MKRGEDPVELPWPLVLDRVPEVFWVTLNYLIITPPLTPIYPFSEFIRASGF